MTTTRVANLTAVVDETKPATDPTRVAVLTINETGHTFRGFAAALIFRKVSFWTGQGKTVTVTATKNPDGTTTTRYDVA